MKSFHLSACVVALVVGAFIVFLRKGNKVHRSLGRLYVGATMAYAVSSFFMYPSTGRFTPFHAISIQSAMLVVSGVALSRVLRSTVPDWQVWHLRFMLYSYVALVVTGLRFTLPYVLPGSRIWPVVVFVALPLCSWGWVERRVVPHWRTKSRPAFRPPASGFEF